MYFYCYGYVFLLYVYVSSCASWHSSATLTELFPCFFLVCKANARVKPAKTGHGSHSSKISVLFCVLFVLCRSVYCVCVCVCVCVCKSVLYYCHRGATQLQLTNISSHNAHPNTSCGEDPEL